MSAGINAGNLLLRNDKDFSIKFWTDIAHVSRINQNFNRSQSTPEGRIKVQVKFRIPPATHAHVCSKSEQPFIWL